MRTSEKLSPQALHSPLHPCYSSLFREHVFSVLMDANCSFLATICSSAYFLQDFNRILCEAIAASHSQSKISLLFSFTENNILRKWNLWPNKTKQNKMENPSIAFPITRHNHSFRYVDYTSRLIFILFKSKFSSARTERLTTVKSTLVPEAQENSNSVV